MEGSRSCPLESIFSDILLEFNHLVFRYEGLHDAPCHKICDCTAAEDYHVSSRFSVKSEKSEGFSHFSGIVKEFSRSELDEERADTSCHAAYAGDG